MSNEPIIRDLDELGASLREQPSVRGEVMRQVNQITLAPPGVFARVRRSWPALVALAACLILALSMFQLLAGGGSASQAFAAALDTVAKARTFSCREVSQFTDKGGKIQTHESIYMFKEPDRSRMEIGPGTPGEGQVTITDYGQKRRLTLLPNDKVADLQDTSAYYSIDAAGDLKPEQLDTEPRDKVLKLTAESVKDMGTTLLDGKTVRMLQSSGKETVRTVYVDPQTNRPVQVVIEWPKGNNSKYTFEDIQIDVPLDDKLFGLDVPQGYKLFRDGPYLPAPEYYAKIMTKMRYLTLPLIEYANDHNGEYPTDLSDLKGVNGMSEQVLSKLLASPDKPNSPPAILYRQPRPGKDFGSEIVLYESEAQRRDGKVAVAMEDGHAEVLTQERFDAAMK